MECIPLRSYNDGDRRSTIFLACGTMFATALTALMLSNRKKSSCDANSALNKSNHSLVDETSTSIRNKLLIRSTEFEIIDPETLISEDRHKIQAMSENHAVHSTLNGSGMIEQYEVYRRLDHNEIWCVIHFGDKINGYSHIVHGGITAMMIDNSFGWLFFALKLPLAVTANLNVNYRAPIRENSTILMKIKLESFEGRKMVMSAVVEDPKSNKVLADASSLFITIAK
eukprot:gene4925-6892_t